MATYTPKQLEIMRFIRDFQSANGYAPTLEEIGKGIGVHRVTIHQHIGAIIAKGGIVKDLKSGKRNLTVVEPLIVDAVQGRYESLIKHEGHRVVIGKYPNGEVAVYCSDCQDIVVKETKST